jgi:hypothetical protein
MMVNAINDIAEVLERVRGWPPERRRHAAEVLIALKNAETDGGDKDVPNLSPLRLGRATKSRPATTRPKTATAEGAASVALTAIVAPERSSATG